MGKKNQKTTLPPVVNLHSEIYLVQTLRETLCSHSPTNDPYMLPPSGSS